MYFLYKKTPLSVSHFLAEVFVYTNITLKRSILKFRFIFSPIPPPTSPILSAIITYPQLEKLSSITNPSQVLTPTNLPTSLTSTLHRVILFFTRKMFIFQKKILNRSFITLHITRRQIFTVLSFKKRNSVPENGQWSKVVREMFYFN